MGVINDLIANARTIDFGNGDGMSPLDRCVYRELQPYLDQGDLDYPSEDYEAKDEVQVIGQHVEADGGTFTLTFNLHGGISFTTDPIAYNADATTIKGEIDSAAEGVVPGYTAGDISVTDGPLSSDDLTLTFDGASVAGKNHGQTTIDGSGLEFDGGSGTAGDVTTTTHGQTNRPIWALLDMLGVVGGMPSEQGADADSVVALNNRATHPSMLSQDTIRILAHELAVQEDNETIESAILAAVGLR